MNTTFRKLQSRRGSSMVMALLLLLVAVMVSATILAAATTAVRNLPKESDSQQAYLTVSSAAETFRDAVLSFDGKFRQEQTRSKNTTTGEYESSKTVTETPDLTLPFSNEMKELLDKVQKNAIDCKDCRYTITASGYDPVYMTLNFIKEDSAAGQVRYTLTAVFSNGANTMPSSPCRMQVAIQASLVTERRNTTGAVTSDNDWTKEIAKWNFNSAKITRIKEAVSETDTK